MSPSTLNPIKRRNSDELMPLPPKAPDQKRRRRAFSCLSCQKLKCRCEYDPGAPGCHRCQTLRLECSLKGENIVATYNAKSGPTKTTVEERLERHEESLSEIKSMLRDLQNTARVSADRQLQQEGSARTARSRSPDSGSEGMPEYFSRPADHGTQSAPIVVLREISEQVTKGYRRIFEHVNLDLVQLQMLDEATAREFIQLFFRYQASSLIACGHEDLVQPRETRKVSTFLHTVCCLHGMAYRNELLGSELHRQVNEQARVSLGQALISSPLTLEEINAMLLMSDSGNAPNSSGTEYIDSWLLTGYCAKQAMLCVSFSKIVSRIKKGKSTVDDHKAIHLWSTICLHHLQWAATTGRPSIIPPAYVNQCNILLTFYHATMQDGMLVAEILLYACLHEKLTSQSYVLDGTECEEFLAWKQKWNHLLVLPTSSMLKVGYHAACLILAVRCLEETGTGLRSQIFLSDYNGGNGATEATDENNEPETRRNSTNEQEDQLRTNICKYAMLVLQTFLEAPPFLADAVPTCICLCIGYCAFVLAQYDESQSKVSDSKTLDFINRVNEWSKSTPGKTWSYRYGELARRKFDARIQGKMRVVQPHTAHGLVPHHQTHTAALRSPSKASPLTPTERPAGALGPSQYRNEEYHTQHMAGQPVMPGFEMPGQAIFPSISMEEFFAGNMLEWNR